MDFTPELRYWNVIRSENIMYPQIRTAGRWLNNDLVIAFFQSCTMETNGAGQSIKRPLGWEIAEFGRERGNIGFFSPLRLTNVYLMGQLMMLEICDDFCHLSRLQLEVTLYIFCFLACSVGECSSTLLYLCYFRLLYRRLAHIVAQLTGLHTFCSFSWVWWNYVSY